MVGAYTAVDMPAASAGYSADGGTTWTMTTQDIAFRKADGYRDG